MTKSEFFAWIDYHDSLNPGFLRWWRETLQPEGHDAWEASMATVKLDAAKEASRELLAGDIETSGGYTSHLKAVRLRATEIASLRRSRVRPDDETGRYDCGICLDSGVVSVYHPSVVADAIAGRSPDPTRTCAMACSCSAGDSLAEPKHGVGAWGRRRSTSAPRYSEDGERWRYFDLMTKAPREAAIVRVVRGDVREQLEAIQAAVQTDVAEMSNYSPELAAFNEG